MNLPELTIRAFSTDQAQIDKYFYQNLFQLKGFKEESDQPVIIDVGAGIGTFAFAALAMGAKKIYCIEPYFPNFKQLVKNTEFGDGRVELFNFGIYTSNAHLKFNHPELQNGIFYDFSDIAIDEDRPHQINKVTTLDDFIEKYVNDEYEIDILKISIGYAELDIIEGALDIGQIESICGETSESPERIDIFKNKMKDKGYNEFYVAKNEDEEKFTFLLSKTSINKHFNVKKE